MEAPLEQRLRAQASKAVPGEEAQTLRVLDGLEAAEEQTEEQE